MGRSAKSIGPGICLAHTTPLREKLVAEITAYQRQRATLFSGSHQAHFSMQQVYKELIQARKSLLDSLPPAL